jgi:hypothetical protein|tara:strand:+ start:2553 stop:2834 length:282 start_codon:yes stop_codon:yes gene_type:complete
MLAKKYKRFRDFSAKLMRETLEEYHVDELITKYISHLEKGRSKTATVGIPTGKSAGQVMRFDGRFEIVEVRWLPHVGKAGQSQAMWFLKAEHL